MAEQRPACGDWNPRRIADTEFSRHRLWDTGNPGGLHTVDLANAVLAVVFVVAICLPGVQMLWPVLPDYEPFENRMLAEPPTLPSTRESLLAFPSDVQNYFDDHFGFRNALIRWNNLVRVDWLRSTDGTQQTVAKDDAPQFATVNRRKEPEPPSTGRPFDQAKAVRGKAGWWFADGPLARDYYRGKLFTDEELADWVGEFNRRGSQFAEHGVRYVVVACPLPHSIYPEFLPHQYQPLAEYVRLDQLAAAVDGLADVSLIDLRPALREAKDQLRCHHRTDSHWNDYGAYAGYRAIMEHLGAWFENARPWHFSKFEVRRQDSKGGGIARRLGLADRLREDVITMVPLQPRLAQPPFPRYEGTQQWKTGVVYDTKHATTHPDTSLPRAVVLHDSFAWALMPFLSEHFSHAQYHFFLTGCDVETVLKEKPDVVLQVFVELLLMRPLQTES